MGADPAAEGTHHLAHGPPQACVRQIAAEPPRCFHGLGDEALENDVYVRRVAKWLEYLLGRPTFFA